MTDEVSEQPCRCGSSSRRSGAPRSLEALIDAAAEFVAAQPTASYGPTREVPLPGGAGVRLLQGTTDLPPKVDRELPREAGSLDGKPARVRVGPCTYRILPDGSLQPA